MAEAAAKEAIVEALDRVVLNKSNGVSSTAAVEQVSVK